jgi:uncharacterized protein (TIGR03437 family)
MTRQKMARAFAGFTLAVMICGAQAATITTTLTVTNASGSITAGSVSGSATLTNIGSGTFSGSINLASLASSSNVNAPFTITLSSGDKITGTLVIPATAFSGGPLTGTATITGGTGVYNGATGSFQNLTGTASLGLTITLSFSGSGTITTGGSGGGTTGPPAPSITVVENNYGLIAPGLPNYALAPSTLFFVQGTNLSSTTTDLLSSASPGLSTSVSGVSVTVTEGSFTAQCPLYYLSPTQIDAVLPGTTPLGNATITVTNNGAVSATFPIVVAQSAFGILSYNGSLAAAYDASNNILTANNAANPGQVIVLWGSGIGADAADDDKLYPQKQDDLTNIPVQAYVGGVQATLTYRGRSQFPGLDQIVLTIPPSAPTGCYVSLSVVSGNVVSNSVTIPIAASGRTCSDTGGSALPPSVIQSLSGKTTIKEGILTVSQSTTITASGSTGSATVAGIFQSVSGGASSSGGGQVSIGSCLVTTSQVTGSTSATSTPLDAGSSISVTGPAGSLNLGLLSLPGSGLGGFYAPAGGTAPAGFIPTGGGAFTFDNGAGGKDVQHFNTTLNVPAAFTWTNASSVTSVSRSGGVTVNWSGGASGSYVSITGSSTSTIGGKAVSVGFTCIAPVAAGQFTVPPSVLLSLPAGNGSLDVGDYANFQTFTAPGLDLGIASSGNLTTKSLAYN